MTLEIGVNSYRTVEEASTYFETRLDASAWVEASEPRKIAALATAARLMNDFKWSGYVVNLEQPLAFPRQVRYFDPRLGTNVLAGNSVPSRVKDAQCEMALHLLTNENLLDDAGSVQSIEVGPIGLTKIRSAELMSPAVKAILSPLLKRDSYSVWRHN